MRMITTAGAHACGKTAVILKTAEMLMKEGIRTGVMKLDCISSGDDQLYRACGIPNIKYIPGNICPDHYFAGFPFRKFLNGDVPRTWIF